MLSAERVRELCMLGVRWQPCPRHHHCQCALAQEAGGNAFSLLSAVVDPSSSSLLLGKLSLVRSYLGSVLAFVISVS